MDSMMARGHVDAFVVGPDGSRSRVVDGANTLLYWCADAVAHMFAGGTDYMPVTIGFVRTDADVTASFDFDGSRNTKREDELVQAPMSVKNVSIGQNKQFKSSSAGAYSGNVVTLGAMTDDNAKSEKIYGLLLKDSSGRVIAVKKFPSVVTRAKDYALAVSWSVTFT